MNEAMETVAISRDPCCEGDANASSYFLSARPDGDGAYFKNSRLSAEDIRAIDGPAAPLLPELLEIEGITDTTIRGRFLYLTKGDMFDWYDIEKQLGPVLIKFNFGQLPPEENSPDREKTAHIGIRNFIDKRCFDVDRILSNDSHARFFRDKWLEKYEGMREQLIARLSRPAVDIIDAIFRETNAQEINLRVYHLSVRNDIRDELEMDFDKKVVRIIERHLYTKISSKQDAP